MAPFLLDILLCTGGVCVSVDRLCNEESETKRTQKKKRGTRTDTKNSFKRTKTIKISPTKFDKFERAIAREGGFVLVNPRIRTIQSQALLEEAWMKQHNKTRKRLATKSKYAIALRRIRSGSRKCL